MEKVWFILYKWMYEPIKDLSDEKFGKLMKAIFEYQKNWNIVELKDETQMAFMFFKNQFDIDNQKYEEICKRRQEVWKLWWRPKKANQTKDNQKNQKVFEETKKSYIEKEIENEIETENKNIYRKFKHLEITQEEFNKLNEIYTKESIDNVLNNIENFKDNKKYTSLYLTANNWLKRDWVIKTRKIDFNSLL